MEPFLKSTKLHAHQLHDSRQHASRPMSRETQVETTQRREAFFVAVLVPRFLRSASVEQENREAYKQQPRATSTRPPNSNRSFLCASATEPPSHPKRRLRHTRRVRTTEKRQNTTSTKTPHPKIPGGRGRERSAKYHLKNAYSSPYETPGARTQQHQDKGVKKNSWRHSSSSPLTTTHPPEHCPRGERRRGAWPSHP